MSRRTLVGTAEIEVDPPYVALKRVAGEARVIRHCSRNGELVEFAMLLEEAGAGKLAAALRQAGELARKLTAQMHREE